MTVDELTIQRAQWYAALTAVTAGRSVSIDGQTLTQESSSEIRATIDWLDGKIAAAQQAIDRGDAQGRRQVLFSALVPQ